MLRKEASKTIPSIHSEGQNNIYLIMASFVVYGTVILILGTSIAIPKYLVGAQLIAGDSLAGVSDGKYGYYLLDDPSNDLMAAKQQLATKLLEKIADSYDGNNLDADSRLSSMSSGDVYYDVDDLSRRAANYIDSGPDNNLGQDQTRSNLMRRASYDPLDEPISPPVNDPLEFQQMASEINSGSQSYLINNFSDIKPEENTILALDSIPIIFEMTDNSMKLASGPINQPFSSNNPMTPESIASSSQAKAHNQDSEYIDHPLALVGHQYVQGGAGEGRQLLGPDGTFENVQVVKSDHASSSYCNPPNPCPIGYTAEDGCLEKFVNSASFSREYQAKQECSCDNEHSLFNCAAPITQSTENQANNNNNNIASGISVINGNENNSGGGDDDEGTGDIDGNPISGNDRTSMKQHQGGHDSEEDGGVAAIARAIKNRFGDLDEVRNIVSKQQLGQKQFD